VRVLLVSNLYPPYWIGGYEQIAQWLSQGLHERGHEVQVLTGRGPALNGDPSIMTGLDLDQPALLEMHRGNGIAFPGGLTVGIRRHVVNSRNFKACRAAIASFHPDLLSFWNASFVTYSPLLAARLAGIPSVVHLSDVAANPFRNPHPPAFPRPLHAAARWTVDRVIRWARPARFVAPSRFLRDRLVRVEGLPAERVDVLHWPVEPSISRSEPDAARAGPARRFLFVGSLVPEKGPQVLLAAFREAVREEPALSLSFAGEGPRAYAAELRASAAGLPVRFLGRLDRAGVTAAYRDHDALVVPSIWDEPFAVVPLEAMALGLPVIATAAGGTPEAVEDGRTGVLVPPRDPAALRAAILRLASEAPLTSSLARNGQAWARGTLAFPLFMDRLERLYEGALRPA
jgi:glycosyltransferase involved in cell wall biosynthesis